MPGPPPNPHARRRNARPGVVRLPAEGRKGKAPAWPLTEATTPELRAAEAKLWRESWALPQAVAWERLKIVREVAMYVRWSVLAEGANQKAAVEARMYSDRLGLTAMAMRRLMWEVVADEVAEARSDRDAPAVASRKRRTDLKAVDGGA